MDHEIGNRAFSSLLVSRRPVGEQSVADILVDDPTRRLNGVSNIAKPVSDDLGEFAFAQFLSHRTETTDIANQDRDGQDSLVSFHTAGSESGINVSGGFIVWGLVKHQFEIGDAHSSTRLEGHGHHHTLIIDKRAVTTAKIHDLVLETIVTTDDGVLARNMVPR